MKSLFLLSVLGFLNLGLMDAHAGSDDIDGFQCLKLDTKALGISEQDEWEGRGFPQVFAQPSATSSVIGTQIGLVYAKWPIKESNGFIEVLHGNGQIGWLPNKGIVPFHRTDGSSGGCHLAWSADHRVIRSKLDPGVVVWK
jgi:hypothetical protein